MASSETPIGTEYLNQVQASLDSTMPWIGMYIAAASAVCTLAMAADAFVGFRSKKYWLPCKYFSINAFSLTVLAVAMKLPVDLTSLEQQLNDKLTRISSLALMSTALSNFMTSLGSMENTEIVLNMAALGILVITIAGNVCIHLVQMRGFPYVLYVLLPQQATSVAIMLLFLVILCCVSVMIPGAKRYIGLQYDEIHKSLSKTQVECGWFNIIELENIVKEYWLMAESSSPQFVLARSVVSSTSGLLCLFTALFFVKSWFANYSYGLSTRPGHAIYTLYVTSDYGWSVKWILIIQCIGVAVGTIAPLLRWFTALRFKISEMERKSFRDEVLKVEAYWTWRLVEWRDRSLPFPVHNRVCKKLLREAVRFVLNLCIGLQIIFVLASKLAMFLPARFGIEVSLCFCNKYTSVSQRERESRVKKYVLLLEGEQRLPTKVLTSIFNEVNDLKRIGEKRQPNNLIRLIRESSDFSGVTKFDSTKVPSLHSQEPPNCWSLPVVTMMAISVALSETMDEKANRLLVCVVEGMPIVKLIEETLDRDGKLESIRTAADIVWVGVELYKKWDDTDLKSTRVRGATHKETLQSLSNIAEKIVTDFMPQTSDTPMKNPLNWPARVIAANSMYRIAQTILLGIGDGENQDGDKLYESICISISGVLAACLTNLAQVIKLKCHTNEVREREESVRRAAILLGESMEILEILHKRELPRLDVEKASKIDEWRASMALDI